MLLYCYCYVTFFEEKGRVINVSPSFSSCYYYYYYYYYYSAIEEGKLESRRHRL